ncbi:MAG: ATP-binding protein [Pseudomonadota bacterium]
MATETALPPSAAVPIEDPGIRPELSWRVLRLLNGYRLLIGVLLLALFFALDSPRIVGGTFEPLFLLTSATYITLGIVFLYTLRIRAPGFGLQVSVQILLDIVAVILLMHASGGISSGLGNLLVVSIGAASLTVHQRTAALLAALTAILLLVEQAVSQLGGATTAADFAPAGVLGAIIFVLAMATQPLARRIRESEALARQRGVDLANLAELNEYIIQHLRESIVVVDGENRVRLMNGSAASQLAAGASARGMPLKAVSAKLNELTVDWRNGAEDAGGTAAGFLAADGATVLTPHFAPLGRNRPSAALIFLENSTELAERVQQTKLAALGRLSASIAHEIRNPVGAISHAGQLLAESPDISDQDRRLTEIIHTHTGRVNDIVESVLSLSRRDLTKPEQFELQAWLTAFSAEFGSTYPADTEIHLSTDDPRMQVRMDPTHLHQVLWNLCENGCRYAAEPDGSTKLALRCGRLATSGRPFVELLDRGPGIDASLIDRVFEPFFTGASDGTGLGLFISRELCECNRATLLYEPREGGGSCFRIIFADPERWNL